MRYVRDDPGTGDLNRDGPRDAPTMEETGLGISPSLLARPLRRRTDNGSEWSGADLEQGGAESHR